MRILLAHNYYQHAGGEDRVFADEAALLEAHGHQVVRYTVDNAGLDTAPRLRLAIETIWNRHSAREIGDLVRRHGIDVVHFHNTLPRISPAAYYAARRAGAAVVQTLHNFRLLCPGATFLREGSVCEKCVGRTFPLPAIRHRCYRDSLGASAVLTGMLGLHRLAGTWQRAVDAYIALTEFARQRLIAGGLPAERLFVKPNFVLDAPRTGAGDGGYLLYVGRLSPEKGVATLLAAWKLLPANFRLRIVGDGPLAAEVRRAAAEHPGIEWLGAQSSEQVANEMRGATALIIPSICYENLPKTLVESLATGTPVIASKLGPLATLIDEGRTGFFFAPGDANALAGQVQGVVANAVARNPMRQNCRDEFESRYTADDNYRQLLTIYESALERAAARGVVRRELVTQGAIG